MGFYYRLNVLPQKSDVETLPLNVVVFGGGLWKAVRSRFDHESGPS